MKKILIVAAHPDDDILGCGGLISKYQSRGVIFKILFIGEGSTARFKDVASKEAKDAIKYRNSLALKALKFLKIENVEFNNLVCAQFDQIPIIEINRIIERNIKDFDPDTLLTHSPFDANIDHQIVFNATIMATRPGALNHVKKLMSFEVLSSSEWAFTKTFNPNYFEELDESHLESKCHALSIYESEIKKYPFPRSLEGIKVLAMMRGMQAGFKYAEAFNIIRVLQK
jgi:LmbE family N-acetylglucosaminyl deacetylase